MCVERKSLKILRSFLMPGYEGAPGKQLQQGGRWIAGGTPQYLLQMSDKLSVEENIKNTYLNPTSFLYEEPVSLLKQDFHWLVSQFFQFGGKVPIAFIDLLYISADGRSYLGIIYCSCSFLLIAWAIKDGISLNIIQLYQKKYDYIRNVRNIKIEFTYYKINRKGREVWRIKNSGRIK